MPRRRILDELRNPPPVVLPSLLLCDFGNLAAEVKAVEAAGARALHLDVMDGNFVPNITYGMPIVEAVRRVTDLPIDVHMMVSKPAAFVDEIIEAGADIVTIHAEATDDPRPILEQIRSRGACASLAINPPTPIEAIADALPLCDMVLCMSVMPGFGAQAFESVALDKLRALKAASRRFAAAGNRRRRERQDHRPMHGRRRADAGRRLRHFQAVSTPTRKVWPS